MLIEAKPNSAEISFTIRGSSEHGEMRFDFFIIVLARVRNSNMIHTEKPVDEFLVGHGGCCLRLLRNLALNLPPVLFLFPHRQFVVQPVL